MATLFIIFVFLTSAAQAVTVGPVKVEFSVNPGQTVSGQMFLKNDGSQPATLYSSFEAFTEKNGEKVFLKSPGDLPSWFKMPASVDLPAGGQTTIPYSIVVPADAAPGGHYAVMWWSTAPPAEKGSGVAIITRAGILVYLRVAGDIKESGNLVLTGRRFYFGFPVNFSASFTDTGNVALTPQGTLEIKGLFGPVASLPFNQYGMTLLPQSPQNFDFSWPGNGFYFGPYQAVLTARFGESNQVITQSQWFFLITYQVLAVIIAIIIIAFVLPWLIRRYNKWIIKKARGEP